MGHLSGLLLRPAPFQAEGPSGYRMRVAEANLLHFSMMDAFNLNCAVSDEKSLKIWHRWHSLRSEPSLWIHRRARWCPRCLDETGYCRLGWELLFADACGECGNWLLDTCATCGESVTWHRESLLRCRCGANLCKASSRSAPPAVVRLSKTLEQLAIGTSEPEFTQFSQMSPHQGSRLVRLIGAYGSASHQRFPQKIVSADALDVSWAFSSVAAEVLAEWPTGFQRFLAQLSSQIAGNHSARRMHGVFGGFYRALYKNLNEAEFDWVRNAFESYVAEHWTGSMGRRNRRMPTALLSKLAWIPLSAASAKAHLSKRHLTSLIDSGKIRSTRWFSSSGREFVVVRREDIEAIASLASSDICSTEAASLLGLKRQRLSQLLPLICPEAKKTTLHGTPWLIPKSWVDVWIGILNRLPLITSVPSTTVSLDHLLRYGPLDENRVAALLIDVQLHKFQPVGRTDRLVGVASLLFFMQDIKERYGSTSQAIMSIPAIASRLGVKQEVAYALCKLGMLETTTYVVGRRQAQGVSLVALEKFTITYVFAACIAKFCHHSPRAVIHALAAEGIKPVAGSEDGSCRQAVYLRKDLDATCWIKIR